MLCLLKAVALLFGHITSPPVITRCMPHFTPVQCKRL